MTKQEKKTAAQAIVLLEALKQETRKYQLREEADRIINELRKSI